MAIRVAINGYGRIGRNVLRAVYELGRKDIEIVAINGVGEIEMNAHLTKYDTVHGRFNAKVEIDGDCMIVNGDRIRVFGTRNPAELPWKDIGVDVVMECTGAFTSKEKAWIHIEQGARKVLISAPGAKDVDATVVCGVNDKTLKASDTIVSNASCTTNGLAPLLKPLQDQIGIVNGLMTTIHSYTNDQGLTDVHHRDMRRARAATMSMIPTKTGAASSIGLVIPELQGKMDGFSVRIPTINVSMVDVTLNMTRATSKEEIDNIMREAAASGPLKGILAYNDEPLVSVDFNHTAVSSTYDATLTKVSQDGKLVKVCGWYDNEWGFSCRMIDAAVALMNAS
jgi:glyceraldehyde 3-phosphate dehydrogenase